MVKDFIKAVLLRKGNRYWFLTALFIVIAQAFMATIYSFVIKNIFESTEAGSYKKLIYYISFAVILLLIDACLVISYKYSSGRFQEGSFYNLRKNFIEHILKLPPSFMDTQKSGDLQSRYINDFNNLKIFLSSTIFDLVKQPLLLVLSLGYMLYLSWQLTVFNLVVTPLFIFFSMKITNPIYKYTNEQQAALSEENSVLENNLGGIITIKSFLLEKIMSIKYEDKVDKAVSKELKLTKINCIIRPISMSMQIIPVLLTFLFGDYLLMNHAITVGRLMAIIQLENTVFNPIMLIPGLLSTISSTKASAERIMEIISLSEEVSVNDISNIESKDQVLSLDKVTFSYSKDKKTIDNLSVEITNGDSVALVGRSGCGKSTLLKLICGYHKTDKGSLNILGKNIDQWNLKNLRDKITVVSQESYLFPDSIYNNILYGNLKATKEQVINAAKLANIHEFITSLPSGYDTNAGEKGMMLSGGERQRIAIARAILKNSPIILFDEPTSALDAENEKLINEAINNLITHHTVIIVAHRLSTIRNVSKILVMDEGKIASSGTHDELMDKCDLYKQLYLNQYESYSA